NNDDHLFLMTANESVVVNNIFHGTGFAGTGPRWGGITASGTNIVVANNDFSGMPWGIRLPGTNDSFGGTNIQPASSVSLDANWFCGVTTPLISRPGATGIQQQGAQTCPFRPILQCIGNDGFTPSVTVRSWHEQAVVIEASTDLQQWAPIYTNM